MKNLLQRLLNDTEGQDLIEYALLAAFIALACVLAITAVGGGISTLFNKVNKDLTDASK